MLPVLKKTLASLVVSARYPRSATLQASVRVKPARSVCFRPLSSGQQETETPRESGDKKGSIGLARVPARLNKSFDEFPRESVAALVGLEMITIYGTHAAILSAGVSVPVQFGVAFAMSRPFRRFRLPVEIMLAAGLTRAFPLISQVKLSKLGKVAPASVQNMVATQKDRPSYQRMQQVVDTYGAAYFVSARWLGVVVVSGLFIGLSAGVDVMPLLRWFGVEDHGDVISEWAAAVTLSSLLYPGSIVLAGYLAPYLGSVRMKVMNSVRKNKR